MTSSAHLRCMAIAAAWVVLCGVVSSSAAQAERPPNLVFILADDLGWRDLGGYGGDLADTPRLDKLAAEGMRFTNAYAPAPICSASRASFLTGRSPARLHFEFVTKPPGVKPPVRAVEPPPYTRDLPLAEVTIAEALAPRGYTTGFFGKWHVNEHYQRYLGWSPTHGPRKQGFHAPIETFGSHPYAGESSVKAGAAARDGEFPADEVTDSAIRFLEQHREKPFCLWLCHFYVHTPVRAPTKWLHEKYQPRTSEGPGDPERRAHYAAFLETLDHYVGQLLDALDRLELADNTLVVFTSDNGGHPEYAANGPLRGSKWNLYEGGIRVPLIARWPGKIDAGSTCDAPVIGGDILPTFCEAAGAALPEAPLDGRSLMPLLTGGCESWDSRPIVWHFPYYHPEKGYHEALPEIGVNDFAVSQTRPQSALREGRYKLLYFHEDGRSELYDLAADPSEAHDLSRQERRRSKQMTARLIDLLREQGARMPTTPKP
ncbi:MAG: sulfatase [Pirellulaceae bacterium]